MVSAIVTVPPYAPFVSEVARHPIVSGLRLNTAMEVKNSLEDVLKRLQDASYGKDVWIDLKGRQLRTVGYANPPFTKIKTSHAIEVNTPVTAYFGNGRETATIVRIDGNKLFMLDGPRRVVGPGESINIVDPSLVIHGYFTGKDLGYIAAAKKLGLHKYMLSFVESENDINELKKLDSNAVIAAKIESMKGLDYVKNEYDGKTRLMAARGDLYIEVARPHHILEALENIVDKNSDAIVASRIFPSLKDRAEPTCQDITDAAYLIKIGYKTLMLGDEVCMRRDSVIGALNLLAAINERG